MSLVTIVYSDGGECIFAFPDGGAPSGASVYSDPDKDMIPPALRHLEQLLKDVRHELRSPAALPHLAAAQAAPALATAAVASSAHCTRVLLAAPRVALPVPEHVVASSIGQANHQSS